MRTKRAWFGICVGVLALAAGHLRAVDYTWTGDAANGLWEDAANWDPAGIPADVEDIATFEAAATVTPPTVYSGAVVVAEGPLTLVTPADTTNRLSGPVSGAGALLVEGPGTLELFGTNTAFTGDIAVTNGTLRINDEAALGDTVAVLTIHPTGVLDTGGVAANGSMNILKPMVVAGSVTHASEFWQMYAFGGAITLMPGATFSGLSRFDIRGATLDLNGITFVKEGTNSIQVVGTTQVLNPPVGTAFSVREGELLLADSVRFDGDDTAFIDLAQDTRLAVYLMVNACPSSIIFVLNCN